MAFPTRDKKGRFIKGHLPLSDKGRFKKGHEFSDKAKEKLRLSRFGNKSTLGRRGKDANNWKGGKTKEYRLLRNRKEWFEWRNNIYERDNWTCQKCLKRGINLHPHHISNQYLNTDRIFDVDNGITFCKECHYEFHSKYGFKNNTDEQVISFLREEG